MEVVKTIIKLNYNVKLNYIFTFLASFGRGIWAGSVLSAYIFFFVAEDYEILGWTTAAMGFTMTIVVLPTGYLADKFRRDILLKLAGAVMFIATVSLYFATTILEITVALALFGAAQGLLRPSGDALFADSVSTGKRSKLYAYQHVIRQLAMAFGPFVNVFLFYVLGDEWHLGILKAVMGIGLLFQAFSTIPLFLLKDRKSMGAESESLEEQTVISENRKYSSNIVPYLLITSNLIIGMGAGMTVRYFPIFFLKIYDLKPIVVNIILGLSFVMTGIMGLVAQRYSMKNGRAVAIIIVQGLAILCLFLLATYPVFLIMATLFIFRGALMNAAQPLSRSILMDFIKKKNRAKWNSIEAIAWGLFWNLSAGIGGYLVARYSFNLTFVITGIVYVVGTLPIFLLIPLVKKENYTAKQSIAYASD